MTVIPTIHHGINESTRSYQLEVIEQIEKHSNQQYARLTGVIWGLLGTIEIDTFVILQKQTYPFYIYELVLFRLQHYVRAGGSGIVELQPRDMVEQRKSKCVSPTPYIDIDFAKSSSVPAEYATSRSRSVEDHRSTAKLMAGPIERDGTFRTISLSSFCVWKGIRWVARRSTFLQSIVSRTSDPSARQHNKDIVSLVEYVWPIRILWSFLSPRMDMEEAQAFMSMTSKWTISGQLSANL